MTSSDMLAGKDFAAAFFATALGFEVAGAGVGGVEDSAGAGCAAAAGCAFNFTSGFCFRAGEEVAGTLSFAAGISPAEAGDWTGGV